MFSSALLCFIARTLCSPRRSFMSSAFARRACRLTNKSARQLTLFIALQSLTRPPTSSPSVSAHICLQLIKIGFARSLCGCVLAHHSALSSATVRCKRFLCAYGRDTQSYFLQCRFFFFFVVIRIVASTSHRGVNASTTFVSWLLFLLFARAPLLHFSFQISCNNIIFVFVYIIIMRHARTYHHIIRQSVSQPAKTLPSWRH